MISTILLAPESKPIKDWFNNFQHSADNLDAPSWTGMVNPDSNFCDEPSDPCFNKLKWLSDGSPYQYKSPSSQTLVNDALHCITLRRTLVAGDNRCNREHGFVCEFDCNKGN